MKTNEKTVDDFIRELQALKPRLRKLPIKVIAPNGLFFEAKIKRYHHDPSTFYEDPDLMMLTYKE